MLKCIIRVDTVLEYGVLDKFVKVNQGKAFQSDFGGTDQLRPIFSYTSPCYNGNWNSEAGCRMSDVRCLI